jgi:hypothetical protein
MLPAGLKTRLYDVFYDAPDRFQDPTRVPSTS